MSSEQPDQRPEPDAVTGEREPSALFESDESDESGAVIETVQTTAVAHRSPRYTRFMLAGAILGAIIALILTMTFPENADYSRGQVFGFLLLGIGAIGVGIGCVVALIIDRSLARRSRTLTVERDTTQPAA